MTFIAMVFRVIRSCVSSFIGELAYVSHFSNKILVCSARKGALCFGFTVLRRKKETGAVFSRQQMDHSAVCRKK